jgi:hypothetical protein
MKKLCFVFTIYVSLLSILANNGQASTDFVHQNRQGFPITHSGLTKCYDNEKEIPCPQPGEPFYGQHGNYLINLKSYTKLDDQGNDLPDDAETWCMVRDNVNGLIWEVKQDRVGELGYDDIYNPNFKGNTFTWYDSNVANKGYFNKGKNSQVYIYQLNQLQWCGAKVWRMPTLLELSSIVYLDELGEKYSDSFFRNTVTSENKFYWSSSYIMIGAYGFGFNEKKLGIIAGDFTYENNYIRSVQRKRKRLFDHYKINKNDTITDTKTGLMWSQKKSQKTLNWQDALSDAGQYTLAGYDDWRLPSTEEYISTFNNSCYSLDVCIPNVNRDVFPDIDNEYFWTSLTRTIDPKKAVVFHFFLGTILNPKGQVKWNNYHFLSVRGGQALLPNHLFIYTPNQASLWITNEIMKITWDTQNIEGPVKILLSRLGGLPNSFETITETDNDGLYEWVVTGPESVNCMLRIEPVYFPEKGTQQGLFSITTPYIEVELNANALFTIDGPVSYTGIESSCFTSAKTGTYTITYSPIVNCLTPIQETKILSIVEAITFKGYYIWKKGNIKLETNSDVHNWSDDNVISVKRMWEYDYEIQNISEDIVISVTQSNIYDGFLPIKIAFEWNSKQNSLLNNDKISWIDWNFTIPTIAIPDGNNNWFHIKEVYSSNLETETIHIGPFYVKSPKPSKNLEELTINVVPHSGQTECYNNQANILCPKAGEPFYGQSGNYLINTKSYTKLDKYGQPLNNEADNWAMIKDNTTHMIWEVKQSMDGIKDYQNPNDADNTYSWHESYTVVDQLNQNSFGSYTDWRIPTIKELVSLVHLSNDEIALDSLFFPSMKSNSYWSSSTYESYRNNIWCIDFSTGNDLSIGKSEKTYIIAVRGGQHSINNHWIINTDNTVTDTQTGLMWCRKSSTNILTWQNALSACEQYTFANYDDWRLPSREELRTITVYQKYSPSADETIFPDIMSEFYWSGTTDVNKPNNAWGINFEKGKDESNNKTDTFLIRAVRGGQPRQPNHLYIVSPDQSSFWRTGDTMTIKWETTNIYDNVNISISRQGGKKNSYETIASEIANNGSYMWTVNGPYSPNCMIKIEPVSIPEKGTKQGLFTIIQPDIQVDINTPAFALIDGPQQYSSTDSHWHINDAMPGLYTITYDAVENFHTPDQESQVLAFGENIKFTGSYIPFEKLIFTIPETVIETQHIQQNAIIAFQHAQYTDTTIHLSTQAFDLINIPQTVTIPKGMTHTTFDMIIVDNHILGNQKVMLTASAPGCITASSNMIIIDDDIPTQAPQDIHAVSNGNQRVLLTWPVQFGSENLTYDVFRSDSKDGYYIQINPFPVNNPQSLNGQYVHMFYDTNLIYNTSYWYKIKTFRYDIFESDLSQPVSVIPEPHPGAGDFKLVVLAPYQTIAAGQNAIYNISVLAEDHFNEDITLSVTSNVLNRNYCELSQSVIPPDTSTQLKIRIPVNIHQQEYKISVNAMSQCCSHMTDIRLNVVCPDAGESLITAVVASHSVRRNDDMIIKGQIIPHVLTHTPLNVHIRHADSDQWHTYNERVDQNSQFEFIYQPKKLGDYHIKTAWHGNSFLSASESEEIIVRVGKGTPKIFCSTNQHDISPNDMIQLHAELLPQINGEPVMIKILKPDHTTETIDHLFTDAQGMVTTNYQLSNQTGLWQFTAYWQGNKKYIGAQSYPLSLYPGVETGQALIIAGAEMIDPLWSTIEHLANHFYLLLKKRRFSHDQIMYLSDHSYDYDENGDGVPEIMIDDHDPEVNDVFEYIKGLYQNIDNPEVSINKPLIIYLVDHGGTGVFKINAYQYLYAIDLDQWLDDLQQATQCSIVLIIDACKSGTFISALQPESDQKRILISSSGKEYANYDQDGLLSFSEFLFNAIINGYSLEKSFNRATTEMKKNFIFKLQEPVLIQSQENNLASNFYIGGTSLIGSFSPEIGTTTPNQVIEPGFFNIFARVNRLEKIQMVWASIRPPYLTSLKSDQFQWIGTPLFKLETVQLFNTNNNNDYSGKFFFDYKGTYIVTFFVQDIDNNVACKEIHLTLENGKEYNYLSDIIYVLKNLSGMSVNSNQDMSILSGIQFRLHDAIYFMKLFADPD